ncbi:MAG TPA: hypothetical protein VMW39_01615, partial [bacterium]|nr:hypothetical protein [bacterium]
KVTLLSQGFQNLLESSRKGGFIKVTLLSQGFQNLLESSRKGGFIKVTPINRGLPEIFVDILEWLGGGG